MEGHIPRDTALIAPADLQQIAIFWQSLASLHLQGIWLQLQKLQGAKCSGASQSFGAAV
jgi:hypothetical protein